jgi:hypothetical protein
MLRYSPKSLSAVFATIQLTAHLLWKVSWPSLTRLSTLTSPGPTVSHPSTPVVHQAFQLLLDASGLGPRTLPTACARDTTNPDLQTYQNGEADSQYSYAYQLCFGKTPISRSRAGGPAKVKDEPNERIH